MLGPPPFIAVETKDCTNIFSDRGSTWSSLAVPRPARPLAPARSPAIAGARVNASGTVLAWFNDFGGAPQVSHTAGSGVYYLKFPNANILGQNNGGNSVLSVTADTPSADCTAVEADYLGAGAATSIAVETKNCTNTFNDRGFHWSSLAALRPLTPTCSRTQALRSPIRLAHLGVDCVGRTQNATPPAYCPRPPILPAP